MSEVAEEKSFVESVLGEPEAVHSPGFVNAELPEDVREGLSFESPEDEPGGEAKAGEETAAEAGADGDGGAKPGEPLDSEASGKKQEPDAEALKQANEVLRKRLHDTQAAMHKATGERSALQKQLEELKAKKEDGEDWFSDADKQRAEKLEADIKKSDAAIGALDSESRELHREEAIAKWDELAAPVIAEHPDFEKVVYDGLEPLLRGEGGNAQIKALWDQEKDKTPANAYKFGLKVADLLLMQNDPEAYRAKLRAEIEQEKNKDDGGGAAPLTGKNALDKINSATGIDSGKPGFQGGSFVDALFK